MKKWINRFFIGIWMLVLILPFVFAYRSGEERASDMENRMLAAYPSLMTEEGINRDYIDQFEAWIQDNIKGRTIAVRLNATLQYKLFHRIVKSDVMEGRDGWLFVDSDKQILEFQRLNALDETGIQYYGDAIKSMSDWCGEQGIHFYYLPCYDKEEIYPQEYVRGILRAGEISLADQVVEENARRGVRQAVYKDVLAEKAQQEELYYKYVDTVHWNDRGVLVGYQALMQEMQKDFPELRILTETDFDIEMKEESVSLYGFTYPHSENTPTYRLKDGGAAELTADMEDALAYLHYKEHTHYYSNENCGNALRIVVIGDSFTRMCMKGYIAEGFGEFLYCDSMNIPILREIVSNFAPDIVVVESTQLNLRNTIGWVRQAEF